MSGQTLYKITDDILEFDKLLNDIVDEDGNPRKPTDEEMKTLEAWCDQNLENFTNKIDSYCRYIRNLELAAKNTKSEYDNFKDEVNRLSKRKTAYENKARTVKGLLWYCLQRLGLDGYKTDYFSIKEQNTRPSVTIAVNADLSLVPDKYLKPREIDCTAIIDGIKAGELVQSDDPLHRGKIYTVGADGEPVEIKGVFCLSGKALYIR